MIIKNAEIFSANKLLLSPAGDGVQGFACGDLLLEGQTPDQKSVGRAKPMGAQRPTPFWWGAPNPRGGRNEKFAQPKSGKLAGSW